MVSGLTQSLERLRVGIVSLKVGLGDCNSFPEFIKI